ncbi:MAG TPA: EamA family transporter [Candidatus Limivicinus faecipullorum]|nr:EamA family transporter [Candidatus Limivicinus faecipullorum]
MKKENLAIIEMLICATLWSIAGIFMKLLPWNGFAVASLRSLIAGLTIAAYILIRGKRIIINRRTLVTGVFTACVYTCFAVANKLTTAANAIVLQFTSPVFIVIFSALILKKRIRRSDALVVSFTLLGIALFFFDQLRPGYILGNFVAIAAGMFMAGMFMAVGELEREQRFSGILIGQSLTFLVGLPFVIATRPEFTAVTTLSILILGVFQLGISYILYVESSKYCPPLACCLLGAAEPLLNPVWVLIFDGERPGVFALTGGVIVVVSITLWCVFGQEKPEESPRTSGELGLHN